MKIILLFILSSVTIANPLKLFDGKSSLYSFKESGIKLIKKFYVDEDYQNVKYANKNLLIGRTPRNFKGNKGLLHNYTYLIENKNVTKVSMANSFIYYKDILYLTNPHTYNIYSRNKSSIKEITTKLPKSFQWQNSTIQFPRNPVYSINHSNMSLTHIDDKYFYLRMNSPWLPVSIMINRSTNEFSFFKLSQKLSEHHKSGKLRRVFIRNVFSNQLLLLVASYAHNKVKYFLYKNGNWNKFEKTNKHIKPKNINAVSLSSYEDKNCISYFDNSTMKYNLLYCEKGKSARFRSVHGYRSIYPKLSRPALSPDKKYVAFSYKKSGKSDEELKVLVIRTGKVITISPKRNIFSRVFSTRRWFNPQWVE